MADGFKESVPGELVTHVTSICGPRGKLWLERLPDLIRDVEERWSVTVHDAFPGIEYNYVAPATHRGQRVVVKLAPPYETTEIHAEANYLRVKEGSGAVRLLAEDRELRAIMIERAVPGESLFKLCQDDPLASIASAIDVLRSVSRPPPINRKDVGSLDEWFRNFCRFRETEFPHNYAEKALRLYEKLSGEPGRTVYLHGDFHPGNIVSAQRSPYLAIDPKGIVGHIGYDLAVFLNNIQWWRKDDANLPDLLAYGVREFGKAFVLPEREVREWAFAYMVIGAWWTFDEMPDHHDTDFRKIDVWEV